MVRAGRDADPGLLFDMMVEILCVSPVPVPSLLRAHFSLLCPTPLPVISNILPVMELTGRAGFKALNKRAKFSEKIQQKGRNREKNKILPVFSLLFARNRVKLRSGHPGRDLINRAWPGCGSSAYGRSGSKVTDRFSQGSL